VQRNPYQVLIIAIVAVLLSACSDPEAKTEQATTAVPPEPSEAVQSVAGARAGTVLETMDAAGYSYLHVDSGDETFWAAAPTTEVQVGDNVVVPAGMPMQDFHSSALDRDFDVVYFVEGVEIGGAAPIPTSLPTGHPPVGEDADAMDSSVSADEIPMVDGGHRVGDIIAKSDELAGRSVSFRGEVVKFNSNIMGSNWLHVQDGTGEPGKNDLTVTTADVVEVGQTVVVTGVVATDKDFGFGYAYDILVEDARVKVE
jgi:hypothetical protein